MIKNNISHLKDCYGCGTCAIICPLKIIKIVLNKDGFYMPTLHNEETCVECGKCLSICAYNDKNELSIKEDEITGYAAWSNNMQLRLDCSSGGIGFELGNQLIKQDYKACGVKYNPELNRAEHFIASTTEQYLPSKGSKYIQSYTLTGFSEFNKNDKFFVTGTPCQIDSIRRYVRKMKIEDNFVLMDFFCHGVPSLNMWNNYSKMVEKKTGKITYASWRNKRIESHDSGIMEMNDSKDEKISWHDSYGIKIRGKKNVDYFSSMNKGDLFYKFFLGDICLGKACYDHCKYKKNNSAADIRIGDLWGNTFKDDKNGVSGILIFTDKGKQVIELLNDGCTLISNQISDITDGQMKESPNKPILYSSILLMLRNRINLNIIYFIIRITNRLFSVFTKVF